MPTRNEPAPVIVYWTCEQGARAEVCQSKRRGRHLFTRCECCGNSANMTGKGRQTKLWNEAEFLPGVVVVKPSNVDDELPKLDSNSVDDVIEGEVVEREEGEQLDQQDFDPREEPEDELEESEGVSGSKIVASAVLVGAGIVGWLCS